MVDKPSDNRRRISDNLLSEIEEYDGKDFSEQLLKWKNSSDKLSNEELKQELEKTKEAMKSIGDGEGKTVEELADKFEVSEQVGFSDVKLAVREVLEDASIDERSGDIQL